MGDGGAIHRQSRFINASKTRTGRCYPLVIKETGVRWSQATTQTATETNFVRETPRRGKNNESKKSKQSKQYVLQFELSILYLVITLIFSFITRAPEL